MNITLFRRHRTKPTLSADLNITGEKQSFLLPEGCVTHGLLQTDVSELPHPAVEQSLQGLLALLKSCDALSLLLAVLAVLTIYAASDRLNGNVVLIRSHTFHRRAPQTDTIMTELQEIGDFVISRAFNLFKI